MQSPPVMNAIDLLETQHREVEDLFERLARTRGDPRKSLEETLLFPGVERKLGEPALEVLGAEMLATMSERELGSRDGAERCRHSVTAVPSSVLNR